MQWYSQVQYKHKRACSFTIFDNASVFLYQITLLIQCNSNVTLNDLITWLFKAYNIVFCFPVTGEWQTMYMCAKAPGYRFTKGLTQNLNLRTNLKLKYNIKSLKYIQPNFRFQASFLYYWTMSFTFSTWSVV